MPDKIIVKLKNQNSVIAENGPMRIIIQAWDKEKPDFDMALKAGEFSFTCLEQVAQHHEILKQLPCCIPKKLPLIPANMVKSVIAVKEKNLTPMAAVAGTIADAVADWLFDHGLSRVIVNNGGDIAIRLAKNETAKIGIRTNIQNPIISYLVELSCFHSFDFHSSNSHSSWGVNTSGFGGRSLTQGIASGVTVFAKTSSIADAAATSIANSCFVKDNLIVQINAEKLDFNTDIKGVPVTFKVGKLKKSSVKYAMNNALKKAEKYIKMKIIYGALIALDNELVLTSKFNTKVAPLESVFIKS